MKNILLLILTCLLCQPARTQSELTIAAFLDGANRDDLVAHQRQKLYYFNSLSFGMPYIEKLEFRTETNEFNLRKQEYLVRVTPNSLSNIKTQKQYQQSVKHMTEMELKTAFSTALKTRYELVTDLIYLRKILAVKRKQKVLLNDRVTLLKRSMQLIDFDVLDLINVTYEAEENSREILELENTISSLEKTIQELHDTNQRIDVEEDGLPGIKDVEETLTTLPLFTTRHPILEVRSAQLYSTMLEHEMERSQNKFSLGYVQAQYGYDENDPFASNFSIGVGFDIPLKRSYADELNKLRVDILESESQYKVLADELGRKAFSLYQILLNNIKKYELVETHLEKGEAEFVLREYQKIAETPPNALLQLRENTLKLELLLNELAHETMLSYLEYLDVSGLLAREPLINYLSKDLSLLNDDR